MTKQNQYPFVGDIAESINALDNMEDLNKVISVLKQKQTSLRAQLVAELKSGFVIGQPVKCHSKGKILDGFITKINRSYNTGKFLTFFIYQNCGWNSPQ